MKIKKWLALALSAVMAVGVLTACGGGGGVKSTTSENRVEAQLDEGGVDIRLTPDTTMNNVVRAAAKNLASGSSQSAVRSTIMREMKWGLAGQLENAWNQLIGGMGILTPHASFGLVGVISSDQLEANQGEGLLASYIGQHRDKVSKMAPINTPEKFAAALLLGVDGTIGMLSDVTNDAVGVHYNVCGYEVADPNGNDYWVFAAQITIG